MEILKRYIQLKLELSAITKELDTKFTEQYPDRPYYCWPLAAKEEYIAATAPAKRQLNDLEQELINALGTEKAVVLDNVVYFVVESDESRWLETRRIE